MVCIIDDREDVWNMASNLIQVKPYHFFQHTGDINAPPGMSKHELDGKGVKFKIKNTKENDHDSKKEEESVDSTNEIKSNENSNTTISEDKNQETVDGNASEPEKNDVQSAVSVIIKNENFKETNTEEVDSLVKESTKSEPEINVETLSNDEHCDEENKEKEETEEHIDLEKIDEKSDDEQIINSVTEDDNLIEIEDPDDYLLYLEEILKKIHERFYELFDETKEIPDLKSLIPKIRSEVLIGLNIVFSGLVPQYMKLEQSRAYKIARSLGANVSHTLSPKTTHLVAVNAGTFKVITARKKMNIKIVTPDWLWTCAERWEHVEEQVFPLDRHKPSKMRQPPAHCHSPGNYKKCLI